MGGQNVSTDAPRIARISFDRDLVGLRQMVVKGFLLTVATAGIYRFWYINNIRKYFWSRTLVDGSPAVYTGRGKDLFLGTLVAAGILVAIQIFILAAVFLSASPEPNVGLFIYPILFVLVPFALYRARRYRVRRTTWRGMRFGQDGSALVYVLITLGWCVLVIATLGLAFPFMRAALERYRIRHTLVGTSRFQSTAHGRKLLLPWLLIWLVIVSPIWVSIGIVLTAKTCVVSLEEAFLSPIGPHLAFNISMLDPCFLVERFASSILGVSASVAILIVPLLYPFFRAHEIRVFLSAVRLGEVGLVSTLTVRDYYTPYFRYLARTLKLGVSTTAAAAIVILAALLTKDFVEQNTRFVAAGVAIVSLYLWYGVTSIVLYVQVLRAGQLRAVAESLSISNAAALDIITAAAKVSDMGVGEGLADALDPASALELGF